jgi:tRNA dimethylallyltransferase
MGKNNDALIFHMSPEDIQKKIEQYLPVRKEEKDKLGEVFTPQKLIEEISSRGNTPVFVGGSVFYIQALFYTLPEIPKIENQKELEQSLSKKTSQELWDELYIHDSIRASQINCNDRYRLIRALSIIYGTGTKPSDYDSKFDPLGEFYAIFLDRDREDMYARINSRTKSMLKSGWIEEVRSLQNSPWESFLYDKKIIGYDAILNFLHTNDSMQKLEDTIAQQTRHYAKRQVTFLRKLIKQIEKSLADKPEVWAKQSLVEQISLTLYEHGLYIKHLLNTLKKFI